MLPKKRYLTNLMSKLPFSTDSDTTVIIERKQGLEKYLQVGETFPCPVLEPSPNPCLVLKSTLYLL